MKNANPEWGREAGKLVEDESEQKAIKRMRALRRQSRSYALIAETMRQAGFSITHTSVRRVLRAFAVDRSRHFSSDYRIIDENTGL